MTLDDLLELLLSAAEENGLVFDFFDTASWPGGSLELMCQLGILRDVSNGSIASCPNCNGEHREKIVHSQSSSGEALMHIWCPESMRVEVTPEMCKGWEINPIGLARVVAHSAGLDGDVRALESDRLFYCGCLSQNDVLINVYFSRVTKQLDATSLAEVVSHSVVPAIIFVPVNSPVFEGGGAQIPTMISLSSVARMDTDSILIDCRWMDQAARRLVESSHLAENVFVQRGEFWEVRYEGSTVKYIKDSKGMKYLARLLAEPHQSIPAVTLLAAVAGIDQLIPTGTSGESLDIEARDSLRQRYSELIEEHEQATMLNDLGTQKKMNDELEQLGVELASRLGIGGKIRESSDAQRVRKSVSVALKRARVQIAKEVPHLGTHLDGAVNSGLIFTYSPDRKIDWFL